MTKTREEAIAEGVKTAETQHSMKRRSPWHDYYRKGTYMLTMVVEGRQPLLGKLVAEQVELTELGKVIQDEEVPKISAIYKMVEVWKLCIMPDHIHMIVRVKEDMPEGKHLGLVIRGFKGGCSKAWWRLRPGVIPCVKAQRTGATQGTGAAAVPTSTTVPAASTAGSLAGTPAGLAASQKGLSLFEGGYNDKILLHEGQLDNWKHYLDDNPRRLAIKRLHPDFFTVMQHADIGEWHCQLVGNRFLLDIPQKVAVIVHNAYSDKE